MENQLLGFVGVGRMGGPMASRLLDAGHSLCVFDTNAEAVKPLAAAARRPRRRRRRWRRRRESCFMSLPTPAIVQAVALGERGHHARIEREDADRSFDDRPRHGDDRRARLRANAASSGWMRR